MIFTKRIQICSWFVAMGVLVSSGCSTGLFRAVQPWEGPSYSDHLSTPMTPPEKLDQQIQKFENEASSKTSTSQRPVRQATPNQRSSGSMSATDSMSATGSTKQAGVASVPPANSGKYSGYSSADARSRFIPPENNERRQSESVGAVAMPDFEPEPAQRSSAGTSTFYRGQSPQDTIAIPSTASSNQGNVQQTAAQFPELDRGLQGDPTPNSAFQVPTINTGSPNELNPIIPSNAPGGSVTFPQNFPQNYADLDIYLSETSTGRINFGGAYNSDNGLVGQFVIDERNFDITRFPRNFREIVDGTAWRGGGQNFRLELVPGSNVERYLVSFSEPFLFGSRVSFSSSLYYFQRQFFDWDEERLGGRFAFGYRLTPDLSVSAGVRMENVEISDPRVNTSPQLNASLGDTDLYIGNVAVVRDTRDHPFLPTEGNFTSLTFSQGFGEFDYSRGDIDFRTYRLMYQRPDGSGRHTLSYGTKLGFSGAQTPLFENYFAGGFSTMRGFDFRGASPVEGGVRVGGEFQWLNTLEYTFPLTADDMIKGVLFTDFGTVEQNIELNSENFRVAPGFGFRIHMPAAGIGAPLAFDFAFPVSDAEGDERETFSFYLGVSR